MSMQQMEIAQNDRQTVQGHVTRHGSIGNKGVTIMSTITRTAHGTRFGTGIMAAMAMAITLVLGISAWPFSSSTAPATERGSFSPLPAGLTDYQSLQTERGAMNVSTLPHTLTDHQLRQAAVAERPTFSPLPTGLTDYQGLQTERARPTFSSLPAGLTDYISLQPKARIIHSPLPQGLTDYQPQAPRARINQSPLPQGLTDYQGLNTVAPAQPNFSPLPAGLTDYQGLGN